MILGYARVSSKTQNEDRQRIALLKHGVSVENIYIDKKSGKDFNREGYTRLVERLKAGDTVVVPSIDRLGRNYTDIIEQWRYITLEKGAHITVLDMPILDSGANGDLTRRVISDIVLGLLSYVAQKERESIRERQEEGISAALMRGVKFGRHAMEKPEGYEEIMQQWESRNISARKAAEELGITHKTFTSWARADQRLQKPQQ